MHILVTGGCEYVDSQTCVAPIAVSHEVSIVDDLSSSRGGVVDATTQIRGKRIDYAVVARRPGDVAACYADTTFVAERLGERAKRGIDERCRDAWRWRQSPSAG